MRNTEHGLGDLCGMLESSLRLVEQAEEVKAAIRRHHPETITTTQMIIALRGELIDAWSVIAVLAKGNAEWIKLEIERYGHSSGSSGEAGDSSDSR